MQPKLTIGMAHYDDYDGVYFTIQALRMFHDLREVELIVVDNSPHTPAGQGVRELMENYAGHGNAGARYIAMPEATGTSQPRNRVFDEARGELVMCLDCHVMLWPGAIDYLLEWYENNPASNDLLSGPMLYDNLQDVSTHFDDVWRSEMWGVWATHEQVPGHFHKGGEDIRRGWLWDDATKRWANGRNHIEIPAMGLGLFACRKEAWLGFNEHFRGFGGEEFYIHEKFRQAGHKALCLPFLRWLHRFGRPGGIKYPIDQWNKVRNYVIGHQELGIDLERARHHFVEEIDEGQRITPEEWHHLVEDPIAHADPPARKCASVPSAPGQGTRSPVSIDWLFDAVKANPRDLDQHADTIREHASRVDHITAFVKRREWNVLLAAARPETLIVNQLEADPLLEQLHDAVKAEQDGPKNILAYTTNVGPGADSMLADRAGPTDMLVIDTVHHGGRLQAELARHANEVSRYIVLRGTGAFGWQSEDRSGPGLLHAAKLFVQQHPEREWFVCHHTTNQYGLTILSRDKADRLEEPIYPWPPEFGPGTELKKIIASLGIEPSAACDCNKKMIQMDIWGVEGCQENFDTIVGWLRDGQEQWGWKSKLAAAGRMLTTGLLFKVKATDPFPGLITEAIRRADQNQSQAA